MIKQLKSLFLTMPLITFESLTPLAINHYEPWFPDQNINSDWKNIAYSNFISTENSWQDYLNFTNHNNIDLTNRRNYIGLGANNGETKTNGYKTFAQINFKNYAVNKSSFMQNYKLNVNFNWSYNSWTSDWQWANPIYGSDGTNLRFENRNFYSDINNHNQETKFDEFIEEGRKTHSKLFFGLSWNDDLLEVKVKLENKTWWNWGSWVQHAAIISFKLSHIEIISKFSEKDFEYKLKKHFDLPFTLNTKTSSLIDSDDNLSVDGKTKTNREMISEEIDKRLRSFFSDDYNEWMKRLSVEKQYLNHQNIVKLTFINSNGDIPNYIKKILENITLKVKVNFLPAFWQKSLKERLEIIPGKIVNPTNSEHELIIDNPEFIKQDDQEIYVYHNSVQLTFTSTTTSGEVLFVNGKEVEVYNNIFKINLLDKISSKESDNIYQISVKVRKDEKMNLTIKIVTQTKDTTFKWLGWDPQNDSSKPHQYKQYKLIKQTINGEKNLEYDPTINPKTGLRNQMIFINKKSNYPFPLNPLDKFGRLIKDNKNDYTQGYIAEAMVANSGIQNVFDEEDLKTIAEIKRVKINPKTFEPISNLETVNLKQEMQFSIPGLWHYIYYVKDYVDKTINPKDNNYQTTLAKSGSTMHKFVFIGNQMSDYAEFLNQPDIFNNRDLQYFWSATAGKHLKNFLKNERNINSSQQIHKLEYKQIIRYWKEYVSETIREQIDRIFDFDLFDLETLKLEILKINTNDKKLFFEQLTNYLTNIFNKIMPNSKYENDYYVTNDLAQNLNQIDFDKFLNINQKQSMKKIELIISSTNQSLYFKGKTKLLIINDLKFDIQKLLDLSNIKLKSLKYNFFKSKEQIEQTFLDNYVIKYIEKTLMLHKPKNVKESYKHNIDYQIQITIKNQNFLLTDANQLKEIKKYLWNNFLNQEIYQILTVEIIASENSYLLKNRGSYQIINDPDSIIAPPEPEIISDKDNIKTQNLMWIIPITIVGMIVIGFVIFFIIKRFRRRIK